MVLMRHGLVTWGETARESYETIIELAGQSGRRICNSMHAIRIVPKCYYFRFWRRRNGSRQ